MIRFEALRAASVSGYQTEDSTRCSVCLGRKLPPSICETTENVLRSSRVPALIVLSALLIAGCDRQKPAVSPKLQSSNSRQQSAGEATESPAQLVVPRVLSEPLHIDSIRLTASTDRPLLINKVVMIGLASDDSGTTGAVLSAVVQQISGESSAAGIRVVSLRGLESDSEEAEQSKRTQDSESPSVQAGTAPQQFIDSLQKAAASSSASTSSRVTANSNAPTLFLIDRLGRLRRYYNATTDHVRSIVADIGHILPEFDPAAFGYLVTTTHKSTIFLAQPPEILDLEWLDTLSRQQAVDLQSTSVNLDFQFTDQRQASGITFSPQIVDDQRWRLLVNHYDHGNGICVADANLDGHLNLFFVSQTGHNELYFGDGAGKFTNGTQESGTAFPGRICVTAAFADLDNDGDPDLYLTTVRYGNVLLENDGSGHFTDVSEESGLNWTGHSSAPLVFDYDRDGLLDVFLCNVGRYTTEEFAPLKLDSTSSLPKGKAPSYYVGRKDAFAGHLRPEDTEASRLFRNLGDLKFEDVTDATDLKSTGWSGEATQIDGNNDGWPDLYVLNMQGHDEYFESQAGQRFVQKTDKVFAETSWGAMGVKAFDFDNNGLSDLFVTDMHSDMSKDIGVGRERQKSDMQWPPAFLGTTERNIFGNAFYQQSGPGVFEEVSDVIHAENYWPWGLSVGDLNADG